MTILTLERICNQYAPLSEVRSISAKDQSLHDVDEQLFRCQRLKRLDLSNNHLTSTHNLTNIQNLEWLSIASNNSILSIKHIGTLQNLKTFNCSHNRIAHLESLTHCKSLVALIANNNQIEIIIKNKLPISLSTLILSHNLINELSGIIHLGNLTKLSLSHNKIQEIPPELFISCKNLSELRINHNQIKHIPIDIKNCARLKLLLISHNQIEDKLELNVLIDLPWLRNLSVNDNPLCRKYSYSNDQNINQNNENSSIRISEGNMSGKSSPEQASNSRRLFDYENEIIELLPLLNILNAVKVERTPEIQKKIKEQKRNKKEKQRYQEYQIDHKSPIADHDDERQSFSTSVERERRSRITNDNNMSNFNQSHLTQRISNGSNNQSTKSLNDKRSQPNANDSGRSKYRSGLVAVIDNKESKKGKKNDKKNKKKNMHVVPSSNIIPAAVSFSSMAISDSASPSLNELLQPQQNLILNKIGTRSQSAWDEDDDNLTLTQRASLLRANELNNQNSSNLQTVNSNNQTENSTNLPPNKNSQKSKLNKIKTKKKRKSNHTTDENTKTKTRKSQC